MLDEPIVEFDVPVKYVSGEEQLKGSQHLPDRATASSASRDRVTTPKHARLGNLGHVERGKNFGHVRPTPSVHLDHVVQRSHGLRSNVSG